MQDNSGFLFKLITAADTGDVLFAGTALHAQEHLAVGTFKIPVVPTVFHPPGKLADFCFPSGSEFNILPVFCCALIQIPGKHPE